MQLVRSDIVKKKQEREKRELIQGLWGEGGPYSQVKVEREIRILDRNISREMYYVYANINPATINVLLRLRDKISNPGVLKILDEAKYRGHHDGYVFWPTDRLENNLEEANKLGYETAKQIEQMHALVIEWLSLD
jgi:hypothetical protein